MSVRPARSQSTARSWRQPIVGFGWAHLIAFFVLDGLLAIALVILISAALSNEIEIPETNAVDDAALARAIEEASPPIDASPLDALDVSGAVLNALATTRQLLETPPTASPDDEAPAREAAQATPTPSPTPKPPPTPTRAPLALQPPTTYAASLLPWPKTLNIVLLGSDKRPNDRGWRTDTIIIVAINPDVKQVGVISVPRDLWVQLPNYANRINTLDVVGGPMLVKQVLQSQLGIPIHYYARVDFNGFVKAIDTLGGITVDVECRLVEMDGDRVVLNIPPGQVPMNGELALWYARSRKTTSDFDRMRRQEAILLAVRRKLLSPELLPRLPELVSTLSSMVQTDIPPKTMLALARLGAEIQLKDVHGFLIDERIVRPWTTPNGAAVQLGDPNKIQSGVANLWNGPQLTDAIKHRGACAK